MSLETALSALQHDAGMWDDTAQVTSQAAQAAASLTLSADDLSWGAVNTPLLGTYDGAQHTAHRLLTEATAVYEQLSITLTEVAGAYQETDNAAATNLQGVWDVRE